MKQKFFVRILIICLFTSIPDIHAYSDHDIAIIHNFAKLQLNNIPSSFYMQTRSRCLPITFSSDIVYQDVIKKWQAKVNLGYEKLFKALYDEVNVSPQEFSDLLNDPAFAQQHYVFNHSVILMNMMDGWLDSRNVHPDIVKFTESQLKKYTNVHNIRVLFADSLNGLVKVYKNQEYGYSVCFNASLYNNKYIKEYYAFMRKQPSSYHVKYMGDGLGMVNNAILMQAGFIQAAVSMSSNTERLEYLLYNYNLNEQAISMQTFTLLAKLKYFQSLLVSVFQVNNPLELAIFYMKSDWFDQETISLWQSLVKDLLASYDQQTLQRYFAFVTSIQQEVLSS